MLEEDFLATYIRNTENYYQNLVRLQGQHRSKFLLPPELSAELEEDIKLSINETLQRRSRSEIYNILKLFVQLGHTELVDNALLSFVHPFPEWLSREKNNLIIAALQSPIDEPNVLNVIFEYMGPIESYELSTLMDTGNLCEEGLTEYLKIAVENAEGINADNFTQCFWAAVRRGLSSMVDNVGNFIDDMEEFDHALALAVSNHDIVNENVLGRTLPNLPANSPTYDLTQTELLNILYKVFQKRYKTIKILLEFGADVNNNLGGNRKEFLLSLVETYLNKETIRRIEKDAIQALRKMGVVGVPLTRLENFPETDVVYTSIKNFYLKVITLFLAYGASTSVHEDKIYKLARQNNAKELLNLLNTQQQIHERYRRQNQIRARQRMEEQQLFRSNLEEHFIRNAQRRVQQERQLFAVEEELEEEGVGGYPQLHVGSSAATMRVSKDNSRENQTCKNVDEEGNPYDYIDIGEPIDPDHLIKVVTIDVSSDEPELTSPPTYICHDVVNLYKWFLHLRTFNPPVPPRDPITSGYFDDESIHIIAERAQALIGDPSFLTS